MGKGSEQERRTPTLSQFLRHLIFLSIHFCLGACVVVFGLRTSDLWRRAKDPVSRTVGGGQSSAFSEIQILVFLAFFQRMKPAARSEQGSPTALQFEATHIALFTF